MIVALTLTTNAAVAARLPGGFAHSGWFQFELVVLVDTRPAVLEQRNLATDHLRSLPRAMALAARPRAQGLR